MTRTVTAFLDGWLRAFDSREEDAIRSILGRQGRFAWFEDGEARYTSPDSVVASLQSFPDDQQLKTTVSEVRITPVGASHATAMMSTATSVIVGGREVASFEGVCTMLLEDDDGWRIVMAHSSSERPPREGR